MRSKPLLVAGLLFSMVRPAVAQQGVPDAGLAAEAEGRWQEAVSVYLEQLQVDSVRADLWMRVADIEAHRGNVDEAISALERAALVAPTDASISQRLSQAYAANGNAESALAAIEDALAVSPDVPDYWRAKATLATWVDDYGSAAEAYRRLAALEPDEGLSLRLARVYLWEGDTDEAVAAYREYLATHDDEDGVWIELATAESWRGNYAGSLDTLYSYRDRFGETLEYHKRLAAVLARSGQPTRALHVVDPLLEEHPDDYELNLVRTIALANKPRRSDAFQSLDRVRRLGPGDARTRTAERVLRASLGSTVGPDVSVYDDSDGLQIRHYALATEIALVGGARLTAGYEQDELSAPTGSGLDRLSGSGRTRHEHGWVGATQQFKALALEGRVGLATTRDTELTSYRIEARVRPVDSVSLSLDRGLGFFVISPRTVGLGLTRLTHRLHLDWTPGTKYQISFDATQHELSDDNQVLEFSLSPYAGVVRKEWLTARGKSPASHRDRCGGRIARHDEGKYWAYLTEEHRREAGCRAGQRSGTFTTGC